MERFILKQFFLELLELSYKDISSFMGNPCSELLKKMCLRQDPWLDRIEDDYTNESHEMRLNGSGLKMHWRVNKDTRQFTCYISGDQVLDYQLFVARARNVIKKYGFNRH